MDCFNIVAAVRGPRPSTSAVRETSEAVAQILPSPEVNKVGQSIFYDCLDLSPTAEKQDDMKPEQNDTEEDSESLLFSNASLLASWGFPNSLLHPPSVPKSLRLISNVLIEYPKEPKFTELGEFT